MTTNTTETNAELRDVLEELSMASTSPNAEILERFVRQYPQFARELTDFAVELALDAVHDDESHVQPDRAPDVSPEVASAMSRLHNRLHAVRKVDASPEASVPRNPFVDLSGDRLKSFTRRIHANPVLAMKLRDRLIEPSTIPAEFTRQVADELGVPVAVMQSHFAGPPEIQQPTSYKSDQKPEVSKRQSFAEAVASSQLSAEQQQYLLSL